MKCPDVIKQVPARMDLETYRKFSQIVERDGQTMNHVLVNLIKSYIAEYEGKTPVNTFRVVRDLDVGGPHEIA